MEKVYKEAVKYFEKKEYEKSLTTLRGLEKIYPENLQILTLISINFMFLNKNLDGINYLNKIILINPKFLNLILIWDYAIQVKQFTTCYRKLF